MRYPFFHGLVNSLGTAADWTVTRAAIHPPSDKPQLLSLYQTISCDDVYNDPVRALVPLNHVKLLPMIQSLRFGIWVLFGEAYPKLRDASSHI
jgi:hypothetical protein